MISRRTLLRGAGVSLALPWLEAMAAKPAPGPVRLAVLYMPNGVNPALWTPTGVGRDFTLSPTLSPLAAWQKELLVLTNLWNAAANTGDGHYVKESSILTGTTITKTLGADLNMHGTSMDQIAVQRAAALTPIPSLELGIEPESTGVDINVGYTRVYGAHIAWSSPTTPLAKEISPRAVYERIFRATQPQASTAKQDKLLLDRVLADARRLRTTLGGADQKRIDEYLAIIRGLEQRLDRASSPGRDRWKPRLPIDPAAAPIDQPRDHQAQVRLMLDLIALAFRGDTTRVATFMFGNAVSSRNFRFLDGVSGSHHELSHHSNDADKLRQYELIARWHVAQYAYLLGKLAEAREGEESLLNRSMVLFCSALRDGNKHEPHNLPILLAGRAGGRLDTGQHRVYPKDTPLSNLYVSMLTAFGTPVDRFADSTGPLPGILKT